MTTPDSSGIRALKEQIRLLEAENQLLNERGEDILLLGLMAENLAPVREVEAILKILLERVSILYEIPYCGFAGINERSAGFHFEFFPYAAETATTTLELSREALQSLEDGAMICSGKSAESDGVGLDIRGVEPTQIVLIPCSCRFEPRGLFVFVHDGSNPEYLPRKLVVLQQVIGLATARIDNILLLEELRRVNSELESRVHDRTLDLQRTALALESEIAERRHAEKIIEGERHRLRTVLENLPEGVIVLDSDNRVVLANSAVIHARPITGEVEIGLGLEGIGGRHLESFTSTSTETNWVEVSSNTDPPLVYEVAVRTLGTYQGSVVVLRDVTEQRLVAENLLRQERVAAMGHLAAGVAHDFNNLLQAITILAEGILLDESAKPETRRAKTREILDLGERAAALIRQILDYSRQTVSHPQLLDLRSFVVETLGMLARLIPETVRLELDTEPGEHFVRTDPAQMLQVLTNLTLNANQAMPDGGEIRVRLWRAAADDEADAADWICLSISDTGCGIPPEVQPHIFEPFFTTKDRGRGTGLGLAQTYGIIQQSNGRISFTTEVGKGTSFTIHLPAESRTEDEGQEPDPVAARSAPHGRDECILVVEDDPNVRELIGEIVETLGYRPICTSNGAEALDMMDRADDPIRLVLSDVSMPGMGGVELAVELEQKDPTLPVVLMSGYAPDPMGGGFSSSNLAAWLQKPFTVNDLANTLAGIISPRS